MTSEQIARAFSGHRFEEAFPHIAQDVKWVLVGETVLEGREAAIAACNATAAGNEHVTHELAPIHLDRRR